MQIGEIQFLRLKPGYVNRYGEQVTGWMIEESWLNSWQTNDFLWNSSRPAMGRTQPHMQWKQEVLSLTKSGRNVKKTTPLHFNAEISNEWRYTCIMHLVEGGGDT
jgi:hypothetical protein